MSFTIMSDNNEEKVSLSLGDLQAVMNLIDLSSSRGTFRANELEGVGRLYNHLGLFIKQTQASLEGESEGSGETNSESNSNEASEEVVSEEPAPVQEN